jgi:hypothetical protein
MKFFSKLLLLSILGLSCLVSTVDMKSSRRSRKNHRRVSRDDKAKAPTPVTVDSLKAASKTEKNKANDASKICCHLTFTDAQSKLPGAVTDIHVWGVEDKCKNVDTDKNKIKAEKTQFNKADCKKQEIKRNPSDNKNEKQATNPVPAKKAKRHHRK